jgi:hypothetical protein
MDVSVLDWADDDDDNDDDDGMAATSAPTTAHDTSNSLASAAATTLDSANAIHIQDKSTFPPLSDSHKRD